MARIIREKYLFIHCAKTGGTFLREVLNHFGVPNKETGDFAIEDHYSFKQVMAAHPEHSKLKSFGFVRHPVGWYRSRWAYAKLTHFGYKLNFIEAARQHWMAGVWSEDLNEFVENTLLKYPDGIAWTYFNDMLSLTGERDGVHSPVVYKYEDLVAILHNLLDDSGIRVTPKMILEVPRQKSTQGVPDQVSPALTREIELVEGKLMQMY